MDEGWAKLKEVFILTDAQLMKASGYVYVDSTDIRGSDHYLVWMESGQLELLGKLNESLRSGV